MLLFQDNASTTSSLSRVTKRFVISFVFWNSIKVQVSLPAKAPDVDVVEGRLAWVSVTCCGMTCLGLELDGTTRKLVIWNSLILMLREEHCDIPADILIRFLLFLRNENVKYIETDDWKFEYENFHLSRCITDSWNRKILNNVNALEKVERLHGNELKGFKAEKPHSILTVKRWVIIYLVCCFEFLIKISRHETMSKQDESLLWNFEKLCGEHCCTFKSHRA